MTEAHHWHVLHAKPHKERQVAEHLRHHHVETYLPIVRVNPANPRSARERPFFPCYLFARVNLQAVGPSALRWTPGLRRLVEFGGEPAIVPDNFIFELKRRLEQIHAAGGLVFDGLERGDPVKIVGGPFAGCEAVFDARLPGSERARVLLELIRQSQSRHSFRSGARPSPRAIEEQARYVPLELNAGDIVKVKLSR